MIGVFLILAVVVALSLAELEMLVFNDPFRFVCMTSALGAAALGLWALNRRRAKSAVLYFEELPPDLITTLGLVWLQPSSSGPGPSVRHHN
jgi:hypothetical protein